MPSKNKDLLEFGDVVGPVIEYLKANHHPHVKVVITPNSAELLEGIYSAGDKECEHDMVPFGEGVGSGYKCTKCPYTI